MDRESIINDFRAQSEEIAKHSDQIEELHFDAKLKNGTRFSFDFDAEKFEKTNDKTKKEGEKKNRVSIFNAITDIIGAIGAIAMLSYTATTSYNATTIQLVLMILTYVFFITFFTESSVYHLFKESHTRTIKVLFQVRHSLLTFSLLFMTLSINAIGKDYIIIFPSCFFIAALSVFLISLDTKLGKRAATLIHILFALLILVSLPSSQIVISLAAMITVSSLFSGVMKEDASRIFCAAKTSGLFLIASLVLFLIVSEHLLVAI